MTCFSPHLLHLTSNLLPFISPSNPIKPSGLTATRFTTISVIATPIQTCAKRLLHPARRRCPAQTLRCTGRMQLATTSSDKKRKRSQRQRQPRTYQIDVLWVHTHIHTRTQPTSFPTYADVRNLTAAWFISFQRRSTRKHDLGHDGVSTDIYIKISNSKVDLSINFSVEKLQPCRAVRPIPPSLPPSFLRSLLPPSLPTSSRFCTARAVEIMLTMRYS